MNAIIISLRILVTVAVVPFVCVTAPWCAPSMIEIIWDLDD